jgi:hypothetical protein
MRSASAAVCASTSAKLPAASRTRFGVRCAWAKDFSDSRALTSTIGTPSSRATASRFGQVSVSIPMPTTGRNARRKRRTANGRSYGR